MNRSDVCPSCGKALRWYPPEGTFNNPGCWVCPRCKYKRAEGSVPNIWKTRVRKRKRG